MSINISGMCGVLLLSEQNVSIDGL